jgi:hypothetical protein
VKDALTQQNHWQRTSELMASRNVAFSDHFSGKFSCISFAVFSLII